MRSFYQETRTNGFTKQIAPVNLSKGITFALKKTPIVFGVQHFIGLFFCIVSVSGIAILTEVILFLLVYPNPDIFCTDPVPVLCVDACSSFATFLLRP